MGGGEVVVVGGAGVGGAAGVVGAAVVVVGEVVVGAVVVGAVVVVVVGTRYSPISVTEVSPPGRHTVLVTPLALASESVASVPLLAGLTAYPAGTCNSSEMQSPALVMKRNQPLEVALVEISRRVLLVTR